MDIGAKRAHYHAAFSFGKYRVKGLTHAAFAFSKALSVAVCAIAHEAQYAALAVICESAKVCWVAVDRRVVDLKVASVDDGACLCRDGKCASVDDRVGDVYPLDLKIPYQIRLALLHRAEKRTLLL